VTSDSDVAYMEALNKLSGTEGNEITSLLAGEPWDDQDDYEDDYTSPLDAVDQLYFLDDTLKAAFQREPEAYQQIQAALPPETVAACQKLFMAADKQRVQEAAEAAAFQQQQQPKC